MDTNIKYLVEEIQRFNPVEYGDNEMIDSDTINNITVTVIKNFGDLIQVMIGRLQENIEYPNFYGIDIRQITSLQKLFPIFGSCNIDIKKIKRIDLSDWDTSNVTDMNEMFANCESLTEINLTGKFNTSKVEDMSNMFTDCKSLTKIDLSNFDTSNVRDMSSMFSGCSSLNNIDISNFNTQNVNDFDCMFYTCDSLKNINANGLNITSGRNFVGMFSGCSSLKKLDLSSFRLSPKYSIVSNMSMMFYGCSSLEYLDISGFDKLPTNIESMCKLCISLKEVKLSNELMKSFIELKNNKNLLKINIV